MIVDIQVPASKSLTQRALLLGALSQSACRVERPLDCDDSRVLRQGLRALGAGIDEPDASTWRIRPAGRLVAPPEPLVLGNAGTAVRFLTGLAPLVEGPYLIDGNQAMRGRPMPGLLTALRSLGVQVEELGAPACPPIRLTAGGLKTSLVRLPATGSSQELSALCMLGSRLSSGLQILVEGELPSRPYTDMTLGVLRAFGAVVHRDGDNRFHVSFGLPGVEAYRIEGDWSSASYPIAASWLTGKAIRLDGLVADSLQGDAAIADLLEELHGPYPVELGMGDTPDLVPTVVACALFAEGVTEIRDVAHLRIKESDRIGVLVGQLKRLGADVTELPDGIRVRPGPLQGGVVLDPAGDHRMAMAFGLVSLRVADLSVSDPGCVTKSYPGFWAMLEAFR